MDEIQQSAQQICQNIDEEAMSETTKKVSLLDLFRFADKNDTIIIVIASLCSFAAGGLTPVYVYYVAKSNQSILQAADASSISANLNSTGLQVLLYGLGMFITMGTSHILWFITGEKLEKTVRKIYLRSLLRQEQEWYDSIDQNSEQLSFTFSGDIQAIKRAINQHFGVLLQIFGCCILSLILILATAWLLSMVCLGMVPLLLFVSYIYFKNYEGRNKEYKNIYSNAGSLSKQATYAIKTVKMMNGEATEVTKYNNKLGELKDQYYKLSSKVGASYALMNICFFLFNVLSFWYGSECIIGSSICPNSASKQTYQPLTVITVYYNLITCFYMIILISPAVSGISLGKSAMTKIYSIIDREPRIKSSSDCIKLPSFKGVIQFVKVSFAYPKDKEKKVLNKISMKFSVCNTALMGESGSGKSTILQLILRIYDPDEGSITLDGHDIRILDLEWLRDQIGYVGQDHVLFAGTVKENLLLHCPTATDQDIDFALKNAEIFDFVRIELKQKLETYVGVGGQLISGGQKQRLAIAGALLKKPRILILDQATSALDKRNEKKVLQNLHSLPNRLTTIAVSHRVQVSQISDYVYVFVKGQIAEEGRFQQLKLYECIVGTPSTFQLQNIMRQLTTSVLGYRQSLENIRTTNIRTTNIRATNIKAAKMISLTSLKQVDQGQQDMHELLRGTIFQKFYEFQHSQIQCCLNQEFQAPDIRKTQVFVEKTQRACRRYIPSQQKQKESLTTILTKIFSYNTSPRYMTILAIVLSFMIGMTIPIVSYLSSQFYNCLLEIIVPGQFNDGISKRNSTLLAFLGVGVGYFFLYFIHIVITYMLGSGITRNIREHLYAKFLKMPISWFQKLDNNPAVLASALGEDCDSINEVASMLLFIIIIMASGVISCYIIGFYFNWKITLLGFAFFPFILFCAIGKSYFQLKLDKLVESIRHRSNIIVTESLINIKSVTALNIANQLHSRYCELEDRPNEEVMGMGIKMGLITAFGHFINLGTLGALFFFTGKLMQASNYTLDPDNAMIALFEAFNVTLVISNNYHFIPNVNEAMVTAQKIFTYLEAEDENMMQVIEHSKMLTEGITQGQIVFDKVSFSYESRQTSIFKNLSFTLERGKILAVVGKSGSGKSTIINLLQRFYNPSQGHIKIDGADIRDFDIHYLRSKLGIVNQEPTFINGTIRQNISYGRPDASEEDVFRAAEMANAMQFILEGNEKIDFELLQNSLDCTQIRVSQANNSKNNHRNQQYRPFFNKSVGLNGSLLSGGQKQRLALARMLVKDPTILMFDQATSSLDFENETKIQAMLNQISKGKTTLMISHKLESVINSDLIIMIDNGKIVEKGSYTELLQKKGYFFNLQNGQDNQIEKQK